MMMWAYGSRLVVARGGAARVGKCWRVAWRGSTQVGLRAQGTTAATGNIVTSYVPDIPLPSGNAAAYLLERAKKWSDRTALECSLTGRSYTYPQLVDAVARWGGQLLRLGMKQGDTLAVMMLNCPEYPIVVLGAMSVGVTCTVINSTYTTEEVCRQLKDSGATLVVYDDNTAGRVEGAFALLKKPLLKIVNTDASPSSGVASLRDLLQDSAMAFADPVEVGGKEVTLLPYSSGTTGNPKGVEVSHDAYSSNLAIYTHPDFFNVRSESQQETYLCIVPFFHVYGLVVIIGAGLLSGVKIVTVPKFDPNAFVPQIMKYKVSLLHTVPPILNFLVQSPAVTPASMASVWGALCGAAPVSPTAAQVLMEKIDKPFIFQEGYGMTEVLITHVSPVSSSRLGSCGTPLPNVKVKVVDMDTRKALPPNKEGEICILTPSTMNGYINNEAATRDTIDEEGWVRSGDIGLYDDDRYFTIVDRAKDLIKVKALQVAPSELEEVILQHPKVKEVGVIGVPHDRLGEAPRAYIVTSTPATEKEIQEFLATRLAPHKQLAGGVMFISELPKNPTGKILRRQLKQLG